MYGGLYAVKMEAIESGSWQSGSIDFICLNPGHVVAEEDCITLLTENGYERTSLWQTDYGDLIDTDGNVPFQKRGILQGGGIRKGKDYH